MLGGVMRLAGGTAIGQAITFISLPLLSRLYSPEDFGLLAVYASLLSVAVVIVTLRYEMAIPIADSDEEAAELVGLSLMTTGVVAALAALLLVVLEDSISTWLDAPTLSSYLWMLPVSALAAGVYQTFNFWAIRAGRYTRVAVTKVTRNIWMVLSQLAIGALKSGPFGLVVGDSLRWAGGSVSLAVSAWRLDAGLLRSITLSGLMDKARIYSKFPLLNAPSSLANSLGQQLPPLIIAAFYGPFVAGSFYLVQKLLAVPITFLGRSITEAYVGEFTKALRQDGTEAASLFHQLIRVLFAIGLPIALVLIVAGEWLSIRVLGPSWAEAGHYLEIVAVMFLAKFAINPLSHTLVLIQMQGRQLGWDIGRLILVNGSLFAAATIGLGAIEAIWIYTVTMLVCYICLYAMCSHALKELTAGQETGPASVLTVPSSAPALDVPGPTGYSGPQ